MRSLQHYSTHCIRSFVYLFVYICLFVHCSVSFSFSFHYCALKCAINSYLCRYFLSAQYTIFIAMQVKVLTTILHMRIHTFTTSIHYMKYVNPFIHFYYFIFVDKMKVEYVCILSVSWHHIVE